MLHEAQETIFNLMNTLHPKTRPVDSVTRQMPIGGFESPSAKAARLSKESLDRLNKNKVKVVS